METVNGCTVTPPAEARGPLRLADPASYVVMTRDFGPGQGPEPHIHPHTDEAFYIASGEATFLLGDREVRVSPGSVVFVPRGTPHTLRNSGTEQLRGLILVSPADAEHTSVAVGTVA
jgi:mannose-6-phosphate isomerase-like protein (cupin superfamily)